MNEESLWTRSSLKPDERSTSSTPRLRKAHSIVGMTSTQVPRRSRPSRRSSTSANIHGRSEGKLSGLHLFPGSTMASRRLSTLASERQPGASGLTTPDSSPYSGESDEDYGEDQYGVKQEEFDVKQEKRSTSPDCLSAALHHSTSPHGRQMKTETYAYASLPTSPVSLSPPPISPPATATFSRDPRIQQHYVPFSLWDYLREELLATDFDSHQELKWERVSNFLSVPLAIEKILAFGFILCFDSFLYTFTILPVRFALAVYGFFALFFGRNSNPFPPSQKADILRTLLLTISILILIPLTDASKIYHFIRGQETIKLYVIFNALEIADRLCASFGQDILDCVFSRSTLLMLSRRTIFSSKTLRPLMFFCIATAYVVSHTLVLVYQLIALNVAINSYDHALLTLLVSNQFVEIKGSVFKKFEKDNLFQITCADIVERFTLSLMLSAVAFRNLIELSGSEFDFTEAIILPKSFGWFKDGGSLLWTIFYPVLTVLVSEAIVDWLKHAFITKFNHIRPSVYERYTDVLCLDLANGSAIGRRSARKHTYVDQSPIVARRLGFPALPLAVLAALIGSQSVGIVISTHYLFPTTMYGALVERGQWIVLGLIVWVCLVVIKVMIGVNLVSYAARRRAGMEAREEADKINDFGRDPIGEGKEEREYNRDLKSLLDDTEDDAARVPDIGEKTATNNNDKKKRLKLEELTRFTMVKRIW